MKWRHVEVVGTCGDEAMRRRIDVVGVQVDGDPKKLLPISESSINLYSCLNQESWDEHRRMCSR